LPYTYNIQTLSVAEWQALEWLETNGIGGWAGSTITGCNTRRYHGLLVASISPSMQRMVMLSKMDEKIISNNQSFELGTSDYGASINPRGYQYLQSFTKDIFPEFLYEAGNIQLKKTIAAIHRQNTTIVIYEVIKAPDKFTLQLFPFVAARDYHALTQANSSIQKSAVFNNDILLLQPYEGVPSVYLQTPGCSFINQPYWYYHFYYSTEDYRGLDCREDLMNYGYLEKTLQQGDQLFLLISTDDTAGKNAEQLYAEEIQRRKLLIQNTKDGFKQNLLLASDQFVIHKPDGATAIIAGYHWFTDWGRDTMIALPGLCIYTGNCSAAKEILLNYVQYLSQGMIPNRFPDYNQPPEYNTMDASLWFIIASYHYYLQTKDQSFVTEKLLPAIEQIIEWYGKGTRFNIHTDTDELLTGGEPGVQLTWMDAKIGDEVVTPRIGKPVEINALWYNAWKIYAYLLSELGQDEKAKLCEQKATVICENFQNKFWNESKQCLYDVVNNENKDESIRPNQLFAISLPFATIEGEQAEKILNCITTNLYTPNGLRSLSPGDEHYHPHYGGNQQQRDEAYHQGTVWAYLLGAYMEALIKIKNNGLQEATRVLEELRPHLKQAGIGSISEIFDAETPFTARGCIAQAWSVGEILRVICMYHINTENQNQ
jgi:predicted glycogen debranching enzyme